MSEYIYKTKKVGKYTVEVIQDEYPENPRTAWYNLGTMVCFHRNYNLGDKHNMSVEEAKEIVKRKDVFWLPLYLYDHSGLTMNTRGFSCPWDSGQVGYIYIEKAKFLKEYGYKTTTKKAKEHVYELLRAEVKDYDNYLTGNVYGFKILKDGNQIESCWGFFGDPEFTLEEGIDSAKYLIERDIKEHVEKVKKWILKKVPLEKRTALSV